MGAGCGLIVSAGRVLCACFDSLCRHMLNCMLNCRCMRTCVLSVSCTFSFVGLVGTVFH